jgi:peptide/nickel transport system substrate-binding protein
MKSRISFWAVMGFITLMLIFLGWGVGQAEKKPIQLRWGTVMVITTLDPKDQTGDPDWIAANNLYDTLVFPDPDKVIIPWMAESWKSSSDGLKYTFRLKKGIPFHDGTEVTAEDVVFSMDRMVTSGGNIGAYFGAVKSGSTKALDPYTVEFNLSERDPAFMVSLILFKIVNKKLVMANRAEGRYGPFGDYGVKYLTTHDAGSGPFMLTEYKHGDFLKMKRFEKYPFVKWQPNSPELARIDMIPEMVTFAAKFKKGEFDIGHWAMAVKLQRELQSDPNFVVYEDYPAKPWVVVVNNKKKPLDDPYVRKAINYAFNKEVAAIQIVGGGKFPLPGPLPEELRTGCSGITTYPYDMEKAKAMLKQSKYSPAELGKFQMQFAAVAGSERFKNIGLAFAMDLKKLGLNVEVKPLRWGEICQAATKPETGYHFALCNQAAKTPDPIQFLRFYTQKGWGIPYPNGATYYTNPKVEEAVHKGSQAMDPLEQQKYFCEAQKIIAADAVNVFMHDDMRLNPFWRYVQGFKTPAGAMFYELRFDKFTLDTENPMFRKNQGW